MKLNYTNNIIKNKILHNKTICYEGENFPIHLKKPLLETRQKLVSENKTDSVSKKITPWCHIFIMRLLLYFNNTFLISDVMEICKKVCFVT